MKRPFLLILLSILGTSAGAQSTWVDFQDVTATQLQLSVVPLNDDQEKDITVGDFDRDGDEDIVIVRKRPFSFPGARINVLLMNEGGVLVDRTTALAPDFLIADDARDILLFDADGDGWMDLVTASTFGEQPRLFMNQGNDLAGVWLGYLERPNWFSPLFSPGPKFCAVYDGDIDNDGDLDLYFSDYDSPLEDRLLINDGNGFFTDETAIRFPNGSNNSDFGTGNFICDFNLDGWNDILKGSGSFEPLKLLYNDGTGVFPDFQTLISQSVYMVRTADFNLDGRMDIYVVSDNQDYILINESTGANGDVVWSRQDVVGSNLTLNFGGNVHVADVDRDGDPDPGVADVDVDIAGCNRRFALLRNDLPTGGAMFDPNNGTTLPWNLTGTHDFAWIDLNGDGFQDLFMASCVDYRVFQMIPFAAREAYGEGTSGSSGVPAISAPTVPFLGNSSFSIALDNALPGAIPTLLVSLGRGESVLGGLILVAPPLLRTITAPAVDASGFSQLVIPVPSSAQLEGTRLFTQWVVPDPAGGLVFAGSTYAASRGLELYLSSNIL